MKLDSKPFIKDYINGKSLTAIAKKYHTYATSVKRVLEREGIELRHDTKKAGEFYVQDGEKLIAWAKEQKRRVTKTELAQLIGKQRLSPSYFEKYPELGQYVITREQNELQEYNQKLYNWLQKNNIKYKPNDRTKLGVSVTALLLEEYTGLALQVNIKAKCISKKRHEENINNRIKKANETKTHIIWLNDNHFENLDSIKSLLDAFKHD